MGRIETTSIIIPYTNQERTIRIYLPDSYDQNQEKHFPVLYMHDGQNIFVDEGAYGGCSWKVKDTLEQFEKEGKIQEVIVVGIDNEGERRFDDDSPWKNTMENVRVLMGAKGGDGHLYAEFIVNDVKPFIDTHYRTKPEREYTSVAGSSMGGLISTYIALQYPSVFSVAGIFSLASWFSEEKFLEFVEKAPFMSDQRFFIYIGTEETSDASDPRMSQIYINNSLNLYKTLLQKGVDVRNIYFGIGVGDIHNEKCWVEHFKTFALFAFGK